MPGSSKPPRVFFLTLGVIQAIWPLTMDLYLPALPQIEHELRASTALVQVTLTGAFIGMALGQLLAGPLSDRVGRSRPMVVVLCIYGIATIACALAPTIEMLILARLIQGIGASASAVITIAIVRDSSEGPQMVRLLARLQLINGVFVVASPAIGAQLLQITDWRGLFWVLVGYGAILLLAAISVLLRHESNPAERRALRGGASLRMDYAVLLRDKRFVATVVAGALLWAAMMSYMASSAFLFQGVFSLDPVGYAIIFGAHGALMIVGAQLSSRLVVRRGVQGVLRWGFAAVGTSGSLLLVSVLFAAQWGLWGFVIPLFLFTTSFGIISPALQSSALQEHATRAGTAASLLGAANMLFGAVSAPLAGAFGVSSPVPIAAVMVSCSLASGVIVFLVVTRPTAHSGT